MQKVGILINLSPAPILTQTPEVSTPAAGYCMVRVETDQGLNQCTGPGNTWAAETRQAQERRVKLEYEPGHTGTLFDTWSIRRGDEGHTQLVHGEKVTAYRGHDTMLRSFKKPLRGTRRDNEVSGLAGDSEGRSGP